MSPRFVKALKEVGADSDLIAWAEERMVSSRPPDTAVSLIREPQHTTTPPCETSATRRPLTLAVDGSHPLCQNCSNPQTTSIEISHMVTHDGELTETPLLAIRHWCQMCLDLVILNRWTELDQRKRGAACPHKQ